MMEMLALPMRCLLDTLTLCHPLQKEEVVLDMRVVILRGELEYDILLRGVLIFLRDVVRITCIFFFSLF